MELSPSMKALGVLVVMMIFAWRLFNWIWLKPKKIEKFFREQGLKGNPYKFFYGDLKDMAHMESRARLKPINFSDDIVPRVMPFMHSSYITHGKNFFAWKGPTPIVNICEPALIQEILGKNYQFEKIKLRNPLVKITGLGNVEGDEWAKRKKIIKPAFHVQKIKHMFEGFQISCCDMISKWEEITNGRPCEVDVFPHLNILTGDTMSRTFLGSSYEEGRRIFELSEELSELMLKEMQSIYIPGYHFLPTKSNQTIKKTIKELNNSIRRIIDKRVTTMKAGESNKEDLLGMLLDVNDQEIKQQGSKTCGLTIDQIIEECKVFYFAGQETIANLLNWTMILLGQYTNWQDDARDEVLKVFGQRKPDIDGLNRLKVIDMIIHEVLRLYPPSVSLIRMIHEETKVGNLTLPAGTEIYLHMMLLHHDKDMWGDDVKEFKPERFSQGVLKATKGQASYLPFGSGPRTCIGQNYAMLEAKVALVTILQHFSFKISPSYAHAPRSILTLQPEFGAQLILCPL